MATQKKIRESKKRGNFPAFCNGGMVSLVASNANNMKKILCAFLLTLSIAKSYGQETWTISFESTLYLNRIGKDTISNPKCTWQIGKPNKAVFKSALSIPNAIVTDTSKTVPANDTSVFYLKHPRTKSSLISRTFNLHFAYKMDGNANDYGMVELSPDSGHTWVNLLTQDLIYNTVWASPKPTLKGSTSTWQNFDLQMHIWASGLGTFPSYFTADTVLFRFTYITDSSSTLHDGWMIDNIKIEDWTEGINELKNNNLITIVPNPSTNEITLHQMQTNENASVQILNYTGQVLYNNVHFVGETIDTRGLNNGVYLLKYSDTKNSTIQKFVVQH